MLRLIDANFNRCREGLRVIEDIARFTLNHPLFEELKNIRHELKRIESIHYNNALFQRDSEKDLGNRPFQVESERKTLKNLLIANFKRTEEGLRCLEEAFKLLNSKNISAEIKNIRYKIYSLEKEILLAIKKKPDLSLYLVTDSRLNTLPLKKIVEEAIIGGTTIVQLREKYLSDREILNMGKQIKKVCNKYKIPFIIDDRPDICLILNADGVHIGQDDLPVNEVRRLIGSQKIIGVSTHSLTQVKKAIQEDIDYFAFGPLFETPTKDYKPVGLENIEAVLKISENSEIPVVFIGGIAKETIDLALKKSIRTIAVVREIMGSSDPRQAASFLLMKIKDK